MVRCVYPILTGYSYSNSMNTKPSQFSRAQVHEMIKQEYPALFDGYYREGEKEYLQRIDERNGFAASSQHAELPRRFDMIMKKLSQAVDYLQEELSQNPSEIEHRASDSDYATQKISEANIKERQITSNTKIRSYKAVYRSVSEGGLQGDVDSLRKIFSTAREVQHVLECKRKGVTPHAISGHGHAAGMVASMLLDAHLRDAGVDMLGSKAER